MKLMEEDFPVNRFAESKKIASLYDLLAIIIGGDAVPYEETEICISHRGQVLLDDDDVYSFAEE